MNGLEGWSIMSRLDDVSRFYAILDRLASLTGGQRLLSSCNGRLSWPERGVYFFMEDGEERSHSGDGPRVVRVGTHALKSGSTTTLWRRLSQHKGQEGSGGGNHRGSIFRLLVGTALNEDEDTTCPTWGEGNTAGPDVRAAEVSLEKQVSHVVRQMPFLWLAIEDEPGPASMRGYIERNAISLLSNYRKPAIDPPSPGWLGHRCNRDKVRQSGLWNQNHVDETYDPAFLTKLESFVEKCRSQ
jgi:hypothetical protein